MTTLSELRQASLKEQKDFNNKPVEPNPPAKAAPVATVLPEAEVNPTPLAQTHNGTQPNPTQSPSHLTISELHQPVDTFLETMRDAVSRKKAYPVGTKVTVDMEAKLFHRAKRYCLDHGNINLRQLFLDLLTNYLDEEGY